jgi:putative acetyltransferase
VIEPETVAQIRVRRFEPGDADAFRRLNEEWITAHFTMETKDEEMFADPVRTVLDKGGHIFLAVHDVPNGGMEVIGCCALQVRGQANFEVHKTFEVSKMAVAPACRGLGVGRRILEHVVDSARKNGARWLYLETNRKLPNAIHLYESVGFKHLPPERIKPSGYTRTDVYMEMLLDE